MLSLCLQLKRARVAGAKGCRWPWRWEVTRGEEETALPRSPKDVYWDISAHTGTPSRTFEPHSASLGPSITKRLGNIPRAGGPNTWWVLLPPSSPSSSSEQWGEGWGYPHAPQAPSSSHHAPHPAFQACCKSFLRTRMLRDLKTPLFPLCPATCWPRMPQLVPVFTQAAHTAITPSHP